MLDFPESMFQDVNVENNKQSEKYTPIMKALFEKARSHFKPQRVLVTIYDHSRFSGIAAYCAITLEMGIIWINPLGKTKLADIGRDEDRTNALKTRVRTMISFYRVGATPVSNLSPAKGIDVSKLPKK